MDSFRRVDENREALSVKETNKAMKELCVVSNKFLKSNSAWKDPVDCDSTYYLMSFVKNPKVKHEDSNEPWGVIKIRGVYSSEEECRARARYLIQNVDSVHHIHTARVGVPYPLVEGGFAYDDDKIDVKTDGIMREKDKEAKRVEKQQKEEILRREQQLKEDVDPKKIKEPAEIYTELRVKWAQLKSLRDQHRNKLDEIAQVLDKTKTEILDMNVAHPECKEKYMELYSKARRDAGFNDDVLKSEDQSSLSFIKYMRDSEIDDVPSDDAISS